MGHGALSLPQHAPLEYLAESSHRRCSWGRATAYFAVVDGLLGAQDGPSQSAWNATRELMSLGEHNLDGCEANTTVYHLMESLWPFWQVLGSLEQRRLPLQALQAAPPAEGSAPYVPVPVVPAAVGLKWEHLSRRRLGEPTAALKLDGPDSTASRKPAGAEWDEEGVAVVERLGGRQPTSLQFGEQVAPLCRSEWFGIRPPSLRRTQRFTTDRMDSIPLVAKPRVCLISPAEFAASFCLMSLAVHPSLFMSALNAGTVAFQESLTRMVRFAHADQVEIGQRFLVPAGLPIEGVVQVVQNAERPDVGASLHRCAPDPDPVLLRASCFQESARFLFVEVRAVHVSFCRGSILYLETSASSASATPAFFLCATAFAAILPFMAGEILPRVFAAGSPFGFLFVFGQNPDLDIMLWSAFEVKILRRGAVSCEFSYFAIPIAPAGAQAGHWQRAPRSVRGNASNYNNCGACAAQAAAAPPAIAKRAVAIELGHRVEIAPAVRVMALAGKRGEVNLRAGWFWLKNAWRSAGEISANTSSMNRGSEPVGASAQVNVFENLHLALASARDEDLCGGEACQTGSIDALQRLAPLTRGLRAAEGRGQGS
ncbi:unnamed protein product [Prorocentrum cordatum]|uniref:Uncharacterized protein n=1 Tax=Prorocentrum cordatum TaxID=2364126 RepID=A0ABN9QYY9_9DINO|nr:unnamed protein product [Polarella glacialis]